MDLDKRRLQAQFGTPDFAGVRVIGVDEFALHKGHRYATIVVESGSEVVSAVVPVIGELLAPPMAALAITLGIVGIRRFETRRASGVASAAVAGTSVAAASDRIALAILGGSILVQFGLLRVVGVDTTEFSTKDHLYVAFMTFSLWFVTWAILLTSGTSI